MVLAQKQKYRSMEQDRNDMYTLLYVIWITIKNLLYSTGNSTQYSVMAYMGKESKKKKEEWIYVYV